MRTTIISLLIALTCVTAYAENTEDRFLMDVQVQVVLPFYRCLDLATESELEHVTRPLQKERYKMQAEIWGKVISKCYSIINKDESKDRVLLHYEGEPLQAKGFLEGLVYFGRQYVSWRVMEVVNTEE